MEDHVSACVRKRSTHPRRTKWFEKPADFAEPGDPGQVLEDVLRYLAEKPLASAENGNGVPPEAE